MEYKTLIVELDTQKWSITSYVDDNEGLSKNIDEEIRNFLKDNSDFKLNSWQVLDKYKLTIKIMFVFERAIRGVR